MKSGPPPVVSISVDASGTPPQRQRSPSRPVELTPIHNPACRGTKPFWLADSIEPKQPLKFKVPNYALCASWTLRRKSCRERPKS